MKTKPPKKTKSKKSKIFLWKIFFLAIIWLTITLAFALLYFGYDLPDVRLIDHIPKTRKVTLLSKNGEVLHNFGDLYHRDTTFKQLPKSLVNAVIATEDRRFFYHHGLDVIGIARAAYHNYKAGSAVQGGSTISQQLAKIVFLSPNKTIKRKVQELILAFYLEKNYSKEQILCEYLNRAYFGSGIYGVSAAAKYYFAKDITALNLYESAIIAGLLKAPTRYSPRVNTGQSEQRAWQVLLNMKDAGYINSTDLSAASLNPVILNTRNLGSLKSLYFANYVLDQINEMLPDLAQDLIVKTTLDPTLQARVETIVLKQLLQSEKTHNVSQAASLTLSMDGKILAMVGGKDYQLSSFNRATQAKRQPGSAFKPIVFLAALQNGYLPEQIVNDDPVSIGKWRPQNYNRKYLGNITLTDALAKSVNTVSVRLAQKIGIDHIIKLSRTLGIKSPLPRNISLALGTAELSMTELSGAYLTIANRGKFKPVQAIEYVKNSKGRTLYLATNPSLTPVIAPNIAKDLNEMLRAVVRNGTGKNAAILQNVSGKTGTSQDFRDAWFIGYSDLYLTCVWLGNDDNKPMKKVTGAGLPALIFRDIMNVAHHNLTLLAEDHQILDDF